MRRSSDIAYMRFMNSNLPPPIIRKLLALPTSLVRDIADFRFANRLGTESEAMRRLLEAGLKASAESPVRRTGEK